MFFLGFFQFNERDSGLSVLPLLWCWLVSQSRRAGLHAELIVKVLVFRQSLKMCKVYLKGGGGVRRVVGWARQAPCRGPHQGSSSSALCLSGGGRLTLE